MPAQANAGTARRKLRGPVLLAAFVVCFGLFCLFTEKLSAPELALAAVSSVFCTLFATMLLRCAPEIRFQARDVAQGWRVPGYIAQRVAQISWLLLRDFSGHQVSSIFRRTSFRGEEHDATDRARRVLATLYTTAAPNFIVLQIDAREHALHFHQLTRNEPSTMLRNLGAQP